MQLNAENGWSLKFRGLQAEEVAGRVVLRAARQGPRGPAATVVRGRTHDQSDLGPGLRQVLAVLLRRRDRPGTRGAGQVQRAHAAPTHVRDAMPGQHELTMVAE